MEVSIRCVLPDRKALYGRNNRGRRQCGLCDLLIGRSDGVRLMSAVLQNLSTQT